MTLTARISGESDHILQELVAKTGKSKIEIIDEALKSYRFHEGMKLLNKEYERLRD
jgi:Ribbon-helix-helix protein, copG family